MALSRADKAAGRVFRDEQTSILLEATDKLKSEAEAEGKVFFVVPPFLATYRHLCPHHKSPGRPDGISTSMKLGEVYIHSPAYVVAEVPRGEAQRPELVVFKLDQSEAILAASHRHDVAAGRLGFVYKKGKCVCGATAQSRVGKLVDAYERPPIKGREAR